MPGWDELVHLWACPYPTGVVVISRNKMNEPKKKKWVISKISRWLQGCWKTKIGWIKSTFLQTFTGFKIYCNSYLQSFYIYLPKAARGFCDREGKTGKDERESFDRTSWSLLLGGLQVVFLDPSFSKPWCCHWFWNIIDLCLSQPVLDHKGHQRRDGLVWSDVPKGQKL